MFLPGQSGVIDYEDEEKYRYEFVDDNDDQDRWPDWKRVNFEPEGFIEGGTGITQAWGVFPGLDENNDFISDFNQNQNLRPDYDEPFLRYNVDPPEFLFGMDMDHNTVIDRFEDDDLPDRFTEERVADAGLTQGMTVDIQKLVTDFYAAMGWDENGRPTPRKLRDLGLEGFVPETG